MCEFCEKITLVPNFKSPKDYEKTMAYIDELIKKSGFLLVDGTCPVDGYKRGGYWVDDIIYHIIECPKCGQKFTSIVNTYRGGGSFKKG